MVGGKAEINKPALMSTSKKNSNRMPNKSGMRMVKAQHKMQITAKTPLHPNSK